MESYEEQHARLSKDFVWLDDDQVRNLPDEERYSYISKRKLIWDTYSMCQIIETAKKDARERVRREREERENLEWKKGVVANLLKLDKLSNSQIAKALNISEEEILKVKNNQL